MVSLQDRRHYPLPGYPTSGRYCYWGHHQRFHYHLSLKRIPLDTQVSSASI
jgi:hypothetical protein